MHWLGRKSFILCMLRVPSNRAYLRIELRSTPINYIPQAQIES